MSRREDRVDRPSKFVIALGHDSAGVVRAQRDEHPVPRVAPVGMVIESFGYQRHPGHERLGAAELEQSDELQLGVAPDALRSPHEGLLLVSSKDLLNFSGP